MKKLISLTVVFVILCAMTVCPVAFADGETSDNAYEWMELGQLSTSGTNYVNGTSYTSKYKADGTVCTSASDATSNAVALKVKAANGYIVFGNVDFGTVAPTSVIFNVLVDVKIDSTVRVYALPVGTNALSTASGKITSMTLPLAEGQEEATTVTDATAIDAYKIGEWARKAGQYSPYYDYETAASGYYTYEYKLDSTKAAALINAGAESNPYMIVICGSDGGTPVIRNFKFASDTLDAFAMQSTWYNAARTNIDTSENRTGINKALSTGQTASDYSAYMIYDNVDFGTTAARDIAVSLFYSKGTGCYDGDIAVEIDINDDGAFTDDERFAQITTVDTNTASTSACVGTSHYALLSENITGVHDVKVNFLDPYIARLHNIRFNVVDPETDVYGDVTVTESEGTYSVNMPIRKEYIKGAGKIIVALYNADGEGNPVSLSKVTSDDFTIDATAHTDYGWDTAAAVITFPAADIEGKVVKAFLWKDMNNLVPLSAASATAGVVTAQ